MAGLTKQTLSSGLYSITLRAHNGMEQSMAALIPNDTVRQHYIDKAHRAGLEIEIKEINQPTAIPKREWRFF